MRIITDVIPHRIQKYDTVGMWSFDFGNLNIEVSDMKNEDFEMLVTLHEIIEAYLCYKSGISGNLVTTFDTNFKGKGEPGDSKDCPYQKQHKFATMIEKKLAKQLGVSWKKYEQSINKL